MAGKGGPRQLHRDSRLKVAAGRQPTPAPALWSAEAALADAALAKVRRRLLPFLFLLYIVNYMDRINVGFASLRMDHDLGLSDQVFGVGAGLFFIGYFIFEIPSNLILARVGARTWIARIMITWGLVAIAMMFVRGERSFYALRFLLGAAWRDSFPAWFCISDGGFRNASALARSHCS